MERLGCATLAELMDRLKCSANVSLWLAYLRRCDEIEAEKMKAMLGGEK